MNDLLWFLVWGAVMAAMLGAYLLIMRRHQRDVRGAIRHAAVYVPAVTVPSGGARTFACSHFSVGNVQSASCGICGPLPAAA